MSALNFNALLTTRDFEAGMEKIRQEIRSASGVAQRETKVMDSSFRNLGLGIASYFSGQALAGFAKQLINVRGEFQKTEVAFTTMLGNANQAQALMGQMVELAAKTPFGLKDVADGAKQLLAFQVPAEEIVDTLTRMGNIAAGLSVPLERVNLVYGQIKALGKLTTQDMKQFMTMGIPLASELARKFGVAESAIYEMVTAGKVGFKDVQDVLHAMTNEGGMFFNLMEEQSKTLSGQLANLEDAIDQLFNSIGESSQGILSGILSELTYAVENYKGLVEVIGTLIAMYGTYRAAIIVHAGVLQVAVAREAGFTAAQMARLTVTGLLTKAQAALNATMIANPYAMATALLAGLIIAITKFTTQLSTAEEIQEEFNETLSKHRNGVVDTKSKIDAMVSAIKSENTSTEQRNELTKKLNTLTDGKIKGLTAERIRTGELDSQIKLHIETLYKQAEAMAYVDKLQSLYRKKADNEEAIRRGKAGEQTMGEAFSLLLDADTYKNGGWKKLINPNENFGTSLVHKAQEENKAIEKEIEATKRVIDSKADLIADAEKKSTDVQVASIEDGTEKKKKAREEEIEKIYGEDTIKGLQQRISKLNETIETTPLSSPDLSKLLAQREQFEERLKEAEKRVQKENFEEEVGELKRQISVRNKLLQQGVSQESVDKMFPDVKGLTYLKVLEDLHNKLRQIVDDGQGTDEDAYNLKFITDQIDELQGKESVLTGIAEKIEDFKAKIQGDDLISKLNKSQDKDLSLVIDEEEATAINKLYDDARKAEAQRLADSYRQFLEAHKSFEEQKLQISKNYDELRSQAKNDAEREKINEAEKEDLSALALKEFQNSDAWVKGFQDMANLSSRELDKVIAEFEKFSDEAGKSLSPTDLKTYQDALKQLKDEALNRNPFKALASAVKEYINNVKSGKDATLSLKDTLKAVSASADLLNSGISSAMEITDALGIEIGEDAQEIIAGVQTTLGGVSDLASGIASMNPAQIIKGIAGVVKGLAQIFNGDRKHERRIKEWARAVEGLKEKYEELQMQVKKALGEDTYSDQRKIVTNLREQQRMLQKMMAEEEKKKKKDKGKISDYKEQIKAIDQQIEEIYDNITQSVLQTDAKTIAGQLADALIEAYGKGEDAAKAYGKVADDVMKNAVKNALKLQLLEKPMQDMIQQMLRNMGFDDKGNGSFDGLTKEERDSLKQMMATASQNYMDALGAYSDLFGETSENAQGLRGDIKGVTEKTAGALEAQINAMRVIQVESLNIHRQNKQTFDNQLRVQSQIEINTRPLIQMAKDISELNSKTKNSLAGI